MSRHASFWQWRDAVSYAVAKATTTGRRQRVTRQTTPRFGLRGWQVREVDAA